MSPPSFSHPPCTITPSLLNLVAQISEVVGRRSAFTGQEGDLRLRRLNSIRTIQGTLAIEGNGLSEAQITALLAGKRVVAPPREVQEARNALVVYERFAQWRPEVEADLLAAHGVLMAGLVDEPGRYRRGAVGVMKGEVVVHLAPPAERVPALMHDLFAWLAAVEVHPLISAAIFHYEFAFIHPFADGNGRMARLWQSLILSRWQPLFAELPVESLVRDHQHDYHQAIGQSSDLGDAGPFVEFMLRMMLAAFAVDSPQVAQQVSPQVKRLLESLQGAMSRDQLQKALGLLDRKSFRSRYLQPALAAGLIEMTIPDKPNSRLQLYRLSDHGRHWLHLDQGSEESFQ